MKPLSDYDHKLEPLWDECPVRAALDVIRGRWKPSILFELRDGAKRFSDLQAALPQITAQALTVQLRQLEVDEIVARKVYAEVPVRVEYALSEYGLTLSGVLDQLER
jgi:DNA-binding HxlR family transcriptional regulator